MKSLKISLIAIVVLAIITLIFSWIQDQGDPTKFKASENLFTREIEQNIDSLKVKPDNSFCEDYYNYINDKINQFYQPNPPQYPFGRYGKTQIENNQWKDDLERNLYAAYAEKYIKQTKSVFLGSLWKSEDLKFIQSEKNALIKSKFLDSGGPVYKDYMSIQRVLDKYNEIVNYIASSLSFNYQETNLEVGFPIAEIRNRITRVLNLQNDSLENKYVNNCIHLHLDLNEIPNVLFKKHILYLDNKMNFWLDKYTNYNNYNDYVKDIIEPISYELDSLDNGIYQATNFDSEYNRLKGKLEGANTKAYKKLP